MKALKRIKCKTKKISGIKQLQLDEKADNESVIEFFRGLGYLVYADPTDDSYNSIIIADRTVTYGDLKKKAKAFGINLLWWNEETDFNDRPNEELNQA